MASIPATMTINFTSNYAGPHRICWRLNNTGPYDCTTIVVCTGGGATCSAIIPITVDNETCIQVEFDGYVQAACEDVPSLIGRIPFSSVFTPNPSCKGYTITCPAVPLLNLAITNPGTGYNPSLPPTVSIDPGPGVGATASVVVSNNGIQSSSITSNGSGYVNGTYLLVPAQTVTGVGSGALYTVVVSGGIVSSIGIVTPDKGGQNYAINDTINFNAANLGGSGSGVLVNVDSISYGKIIKVNITNPGSGYIAIPNVVVAPGPGTQAVLTAVLGTCAVYNAGPNCDSTIKPSIALNLNDSTIVCNPIVPLAASDMTIKQDACCYKCKSYQIITPIAETFYVYSRLIYTDCVTRNQVSVSLSTNHNSVICAIEGSVIVQPIAGNMTLVTPGSVCP